MCDVILCSLSVSNDDAKKPSRCIGENRSVVLDVCIVETLMLVAQRSGEVMLYDYGTGHSILSMSPFPGSWPVGVALAPDLTYFVCISFHGHLLVGDPRSDTSFHRSCVRGWARIIVYNLFACECGNVCSSLSRCWFLVVCRCLAST